MIALIKNPPPHYEWLPWIRQALMFCTALHRWWFSSSWDLLLVKVINKPTVSCLGVVIEGKRNQNEVKWSHWYSLDKFGSAAFQVRRCTALSGPNFTGKWYFLFLKPAGKYHLGQLRFGLYHWLTFNSIVPFIIMVRFQISPSPCKRPMPFMHRIWALGRWPFKLTCKPPPSS